MVMKINNAPGNYGKQSSLGDYEILQQCGSGTYGSVYRAIHKGTRQLVALKKVTKYPVEEGFPVECKYLEQLCTSKNVVNLMEYFYTNDAQLVLVFEYMETDLWKLISGPNANVPLLQTKCIMKQLFEGLYQCHTAGIMHRDVKPSNLLINTDGVLKLADFGLTTSFVKPPYLSNNVVSLYYRPPELLMGSHCYGPEIDMWSAGCILVELLTNNYLFAGANEADQLDMIFQVFGTPDERIWPGVKQLPGWGLVESGKQHPMRDLHDNYRFLDSNVLDLASRLLQLDPKKRLSSYEALNHPWFYASPLPCAPSGLPALWKNNPKIKKMVTQAPAQKHYQQQQQQNNNSNNNQHFQETANNIWRNDNYYPHPPLNAYDAYYFPHDNSYQYNNYNGYNNNYNNYNGQNSNYYPNSGNGYGNGNYNNYYYYNNGYDMGYNNSYYPPANNSNNGGGGGNGNYYVGPDVSQQSNYGGNYGNSNNNNSGYGNGYNNGYHHNHHGGEYPPGPYNNGYYPSEGRRDGMNSMRRGYSQSIWWPPTGTLNSIDVK